MVKRIGFSILIAIWIAFGIYLLLPSPNVQNLPNSIKSTEPGDTVQVPGVSAYYNDYSREQVMAFYKNQFRMIPLAGISLPALDLNHPPDFAQLRIRNEIKAWYFEELVHPFRESLYISGWTPALAQESMGYRFPPIVYDQDYPARPRQIFFQKTTIRVMDTSLTARMSVYIGMTIVLVSGFLLTKRVLRKDVWSVT